MAGYRNLNESLAEKMIRAIEAKKQTETSPTGIKDLGESGDVVWSGEDGTPVSVRDMRADIDDLLAEGVALSKKNTVSTSNPPASADGYPEDAWWTKITSQDDTTVVGLWQVEDGAWVARSIPDGGLVAPFADIGLMSVAMLSAKIITSGYFRTAESGPRMEINRYGIVRYDDARWRVALTDGLYLQDDTGKRTVSMNGNKNSFTGELLLGEQVDGKGSLGAKLGQLGTLSGKPFYGLRFTDSDGGATGQQLYATDEGTVNLIGGSVPGSGDPQYRLAVTPSGIELSGWRIPDGRRLRVDGEGTWIDDIRMSPKTLATGDSILTQGPGTYNIQGSNLAGMPSGHAWGRLQIEAIKVGSGTNWFYSFRDDLGTVFQVRTWANGSWRGDWVNLLSTVATVDNSWSSGKPATGWALGGDDWELTRSGGTMNLRISVKPNGVAPVGEHRVASMQGLGPSLKGRARVIGSWISIGNHSTGGAAVIDAPTGNFYLHTAIDIPAGISCGLEFTWNRK